MTFYLGTHRPTWLEQTSVPLFISRRVLTGRKRLPRALGPWCLDSGGFTELSMYGEWRTSEAEYVDDVHRFRAEIGRLDWIAPQDWMCEPQILAQTRKTVAEHHRLTVENFLRLRNVLGPVVIPVLQGWHSDDYLRHVEAYERVGVYLHLERRVGVGTICRRNNVSGGTILRRLADLGLRVHGFGAKGAFMAACSDVLASADSLAWSYRARRAGQQPGCAHKTCANCITFALRWREQLLARVAHSELRLWEAPCAA